MAIPDDTCKYRGLMNAAQREAYIRWNGQEAFDALPLLPPTPPSDESQSANTSTRAPDGRFRKRRSEMTVAEKAEYISKHGVNAFSALPYD